MSKIKLTEDWMDIRMMIIKNERKLDKLELDMKDYVNQKIREECASCELKMRINYNLGEPKFHQFFHQEVKEPLICSNLRWLSHIECENLDGIDFLKAVYLGRYGEREEVYKRVTE